MQVLFLLIVSRWVAGKSYLLEKKQDIGIKRPTRDRGLRELRILYSLQLCDRWADSFQIWQVYAVALGNFLEYAAVTFRPIREVT